MAELVKLKPLTNSAIENREMMIVAWNRMPDYVTNTLFEGQS